MGSGAATPPKSPGRQRSEDDFWSYLSCSIEAFRHSACRNSRTRCSIDEHCINESVQADRAISTGKLHALQRFHTRPINVVVFHGSQGRTSFEVGFPLRCLQRLSRPHIATLLCRWRDNRSTRGASNSVLSY